MPGKNATAKLFLGKTENKGRGKSNQRKEKRRSRKKKNGEKGRAPACHLGTTA
ncbi:hypothetical protein U1Q18_002148, partial [Sarracenia purpurea var. burkii]